jgi:hypothetical protein
MSSPTVTAAVIISRTQALEERSAALYRQLAARFVEHAEELLGFAERCERDKVQIVRTYQETVSDALETGFAFAGLTLPDPLATEAVAQAADWPTAARGAIALEEQAIVFYEQVAEACESLLATIPSAYRRVVKTRKRRIEALREMIS